MVVRYKITDSFRRPQFRLHAFDAQLPAASHEMHTHEFWELVIVLEGKGWHVVEEQRYLIERGDVFVVNSTVTHGFEDCVGLKVCNILFDPQLLVHYPAPDVLQMPGYHALFVFEPYYRKSHHFHSRLTLQGEPLRYVAGLARQMVTESEQGAPGYQAAMLSLFGLLVVYLSRQFSAQQSLPSQGVMRLSRVVAYMETHYQEKIHLEDLLRIAHVSKNHLLRIFKQCYQTSPTDYLIRLRLARACELMARGEMTISQIAFETGFSDSNYFARQFRRVYGHSPSQYRQRLESV